ncbi:hypothetical protein ACQ4PT_002084 [Festuca glaucescens]
MVTRLSECVMEAKIMTACNIGERVYIPSIVLHAPSTRWPFTLQHWQYQVCICYAVTINKGQGQTLDKVGVFLPKPSFPHGQLYVSVSRETSRRELKVLALQK